MWEVRKRAKPPANSDETDDDDVASDDDRDQFDDDGGPMMGGRQSDASTKGGRRFDGPDMAGGGGPARLVPRNASTGSFEGSYDPSRRPASVSPPAITRGATTRVTAPKPPNTDPPSLRKLNIQGEAEAEVAVTRRCHNLLLKGYSARDAMFIAAAPTKAERTALKATFKRTALDRVQKAALKQAMVDRGYR
jgi:hypothetical protein